MMRWRTENAKTGDACPARDTYTFRGKDETFSSVISLIRGTLKVIAAYEFARIACIGVDVSIRLSPLPGRRQFEDILRADDADKQTIEKFELYRLRGSSNRSGAN